jgi:hypothetical protein
MGIVPQQKTQAYSTVPMTEQGLVVIVSMTQAGLFGILGVEGPIDASPFAAVQPVASGQACSAVAAELVGHDFDKKSVAEAYRM